MLYEAYDAYRHNFDRQLGDRTKTVGASEIGQCERQTFWRKFEGTKKGVERDKDYEQDWGAQVRGVVMEFAYWAPAMRQMYGNDFIYGGTEQEKFIKGYLSATPDGLLINRKYDCLKEVGVRNIKSDCITVEGKTIDPRTNLVEAKEVNIHQTQVQMGLIREQTKWKPQFACLTYTDASFWSEVDEFAIEFDPFLYKASHERAEHIMTAKNGAALMPEGWITGGKECQFCPFTEACGVERHNIPRKQATPSPQFIAEITDYAQAHNRLAVTAMKVNNGMREIQERIRQRLREKRVQRIPNVVNWYGVAAFKRYINKEIRQELINLGGDPEEFTKMSEPSDRLVIAASPAASRVVKAKRKPKKQSAKKQIAKKRKTKR